MSGSQCCGYIKRELFQLKKFGFSEVHHARFSYFQWRAPVAVVLLYRFILAGYCTGWLVYTSTLDNPVPMNSTSKNGSDSNIVDIPIYAFLTQWTYLVLTIYLVLHFMVCVMYVCKRGGSIFKSLTSENHRRMFNELQVQPSLWGGSREYEVVHGTNSDEDMNDAITQNSSYGQRLIILTWIFYNVASNACFMVTIIFWAMLYPLFADKLSWWGLFLNIQLHGVTSVIIVMEHLLSAVPWRLLHFIYPFIYGLIYLVFSGVYYAVDHQHILYPGVLDWSHPKTTVMMICILAIIVVPLIQLLFFGIYKLRLYIYDRTNPEEL